VDRGTTVAITGVEGGDNTINAAEAADGIVITGTAEAGSTVTVNGVPRRCGQRHLHRDDPGSGRGLARCVTVTSTDACGGEHGDRYAHPHRGPRHHGCDHGRGRRRQHDQRG
jgi:hypothetical protein